MHAPGHSHVCCTHHETLKSLSDLYATHKHQRNRAWPGFFFGSTLMCRSITTEASRHSYSHGSFLSPKRFRSAKQACKWNPRGCRSLIPRRISMASISRICATSKGSTIDAIGQGRYRVCNRQEVCSEVEGLWQAYETLRRQEQSLG